MLAMTEVILKEKLSSSKIDSYYRYGVYFYTAGMVLLKTNKNGIAREYLKRAQTLWKDILNPSDHGLESIKSMLNISNKKPLTNIV
jgi:phosphosulfolactate synthase (CoM biosynthesis protein A)